MTQQTITDSTSRQKGIPKIGSTIKQSHFDFEELELLEQDYKRR